MSRWIGALTICALMGCEEGVELPTATRLGPLAARCTVRIDGVGEREVEADYLPHVITCENGAADLEALKAQAVAARSYLYYKLARSGSIRDGQEDQVYTCGAEPGPRHREAVRATAGQVLTYRDTLVAAFYVAGAIPTAADCVARPGDRDPHDTERYVTYNRGRAGDALEQTSLGWVNPGNHANRGCKSQNGAHCLARAGVGYRDILTFYYGEDIVLEQTEGPCVIPPEEPPEEPPADSGAPPPPGCEPLGPEEVVLDDGGACFEAICRTGEWWTPAEEGVGGGSVHTGTIDAAEDDCVGRWQLEVTEAGTYAVAVHVPPIGAPLSAQARYRIRHAGRIDHVTVDQSATEGWAPLGVFEFSAGGDQEIALGDATGEPYAAAGPRIVYDAVRLQPADALAPDGGPADAAMDPTPPDAEGEPPRPPRDAAPPRAEPGDASPVGRSPAGAARARSRISAGCAQAPRDPGGIGALLILALGAVRRHPRARRPHQDVADR